MTLEFWAAAIGITIGIGTILYWIIKFCIKLNSYFEKSDRNTSNLRDVNYRLISLEKENFRIDTILAEIYPKINKKEKK